MTNEPGVSWALQKKQEWAEAAVEFDAALAVVEADQRALTDLGFSAMNGGDFKKVRRADEHAVQVESDRKVAVASDGGKPVARRTRLIRPRPGLHSLTPAVLLHCKFLAQIRS